MSDLIHTSLFYQVAAILLLAGTLGFIGLKLRQPLIVAFIATGMLIGPSFFGIVSAHSDSIDLLAKLGISLLLFTVGLKLDLSLIRTLGGVSLATGLGQMIFTSVSAFSLCIFFGFGVIPSLYIGVALMFSSTIIIVKLLSDKNEIDSLHGRISLGFLIVEDIVVILCMTLLSAFGVAEAQSAPAAALIMTVLLKGLGLLGFVALVISYVATPLMRPMARSPELMVTFAVGWATAFAAVVEALGFSLELGGLLAGVTLASTPFRDIISSRLSSLRDFMLLFFFTALGSRIDFSILGAQIVPAIVLSLLTLIGKPFIIMVIMGFMGYKKRTAFLSGLSVAQISEFSLVFMGLGLTLGHVNDQALGLVTLVALITISISTYMITYSRYLYGVLEPFLRPFERAHPNRERAGLPACHDKHYDVVLFGLGRYGSEIARELLEGGARVLGLDFDPDAVKKSKRHEGWKNFEAAYGDVTDPLHALPHSLEEVKWVVCAIPLHRGTLQSHDPRLVLLETLKLKGYKGKTAIISHEREEMEELKARGVDLVLTPFPDAASEAARGILDGQKPLRN